MKQKDNKNEPKTTQLSNYFQPLFWNGLDGRTSTVKEILSRYEQLKKDSGCDSMQKDLICQRVTFLSIRLESIEYEAIQNGNLDSSLYIGLTNALTGLLRLLKIEKQQQSQRLETYLKMQEKAG